MQQVFAVILTFNRKDLLKRCLDAVCAQSRPCDRVIVIDNASHDGTQQMLLDADYPNLEVHVLSSNIGASGGFNAGFRTAYQKGADFVWMMDDDVIPAPDALQKLLEADELLSRQDVERAFLLSCAFTENGHATNTPTLSMRANRIGYPGWPALAGYGLVPVQSATFVSILVPRATLTKHGVPIASMFIWGEDTEYTLRITQDRPGFLVGTSKVLHLRQENGPIDILTESNPTRLKYHRHYIRNKVFIARRYSRRGRVMPLEMYGIARLLFQLLRQGQFRKLSIVLRGLLDSVRFSPGAEAADTPMTSLGVAIGVLTRPAPATGSTVQMRHDDLPSETDLQPAVS